MGKILLFAIYSYLLLHSERATTAARPEATNRHLVLLEPNRQILRLDFLTQMDHASPARPTAKGSHQTELNKEAQIPLDDESDYYSDGSETESRDLFISSTISQDDTRSKGFKERKRLAPLKNKHNAGGN